MKTLLVSVALLAMVVPVQGDEPSKAKETLPAPKVIKAEPQVVVFYQMTLLERIRQNRIDRLQSIQNRSLNRHVFGVRVYYTQVCPACGK